MSLSLYSFANQENELECNTNILPTLDVQVQKAKLNKISLKGADLKWMNLEGVDFQDTDLQNADLRGTNLRRANLQNVNLSKANLQNACLENALLEGANFTDANLQGALVTSKQAEYLREQGVNELFIIHPFKEDKIDALLFKEGTFKPFQRNQAPFCIYITRDMNGNLDCVW